MPALIFHRDSIVFSNKLINWFQKNGIKRFQAKMKHAEQENVLQVFRHFK